MNTAPVISLPTASDDLVPYRLVKMTAGGVAYNGAGDTPLGTLLPGDPGGQTQAALQTLDNGIHFATIGNGTDIAVGDQLQAAADGKVVKRTTGPLLAIALEAGAELDDVIRVRYVTGVGSLRVVAAGIHTWAGGVALIDSIPVAGLEATDIVLASLVLRSAAQTLDLAANDAANDQIDLTLSANGADGTNKIAWAVLRA